MKLATPFRTVLSLVACTVLAGSPANAQTGSSLYIGFTSDDWNAPPRHSGQLLHIDVDSGRVVRNFSLWNSTSGLSYATPDGRYLLGLRRNFPWESLSYVTVLDLVSGETLPELLDACSVGLAGHPSRNEVYAANAGVLWLALSSGGTRQLRSPGCHYGSMGPTSANGSRFVVNCADASQGVMVYDVDREATVLQRPGSSFPVALSPDGRALYLFEGMPQPILRKYDVDSGAMLAERQMAHQGLVYVDPFTAHVFVVGAERMTMPDDGTFMLDADTLETIAWAGPEIGTYWTFDPESPRAFVVATTRESWGVYRNSLNVVDTRTLAITASGELPTHLRPLDLVLIPRPSAPAGFSAAVAGNRVVLDWARGPRGLPLKYRIEAGSAPGASNLAVIDTAGPETSVEVRDVPPGRYFVRVRGVNANGPGLPSAEIVVDVGTASPD